MKIASVEEVWNNFAKYPVAAELESVVVTRNGKITAAIGHLSDEEIEDSLLERGPRFRSMLDKVKAERGGMSMAKYRKSCGLDKGR